MVLIRHCETDWNAAGRMQGQTDTLLNETGRQQALMLCDHLEPLGITLAYSSDLKRAVETAQIISLRLGIPVRTDKRLRECHFGSLEGMTSREASAHYSKPNFYPLDIKFYTNEKDFYDFTSYGGESKKEVVRRHLEFLDDMRKNHAEETVLVIGHGTSLNTLLAMFGQDPTLQRGELRFLEM